MKVLKTIEISSVSCKNFEDAIREGISKTAKTVHNINEVKIDNHCVTIENDQIKEFRVDMKIKFAVQD
jgi:flavin-binding protein dodecin